MNDNANNFPAKFKLDPEQEAIRLDVFLVGHLAPISRSSIRKAIDAGHILVDGVKKKPSFHLVPDNVVEVSSIETPKTRPEPENIAIEILYEDDAIAVVNKAAQMVVHQGKGHGRGTLASALVYHFDQLSSVGGEIRPGIVHRLDRDTTGVIIVAKNNVVHENLSAQFKARTIVKEYTAIVIGIPNRDRDRILKPIGVHPKVREKMAVRSGHATSRDADTFYEVVERYKRFSLIKILPKTGRTHQIRVHLASVGLPVLCDRIYGGRSDVRKGELISGGNNDGTDTSEPIMIRQALHAQRLQIDHPTTGERIEFIAPMPADMEAVLEVLKTC